MDALKAEFENFDFSYLEYRKMDHAHLKRHIQPTYEILLVTEGEIDYAIEEKSYSLAKGDLLLIRPAKYHFVRDIVKAPYQRYCFHFSPKFVGDDGLVQEVFARGEKFTLPNGSKTETLISVLKDLLTELPHAKRLSLCQSLFRSILLSLLTLDAQPNEKQNETAGKCWAILDYINVNLTAINTAEDIANGLFFSKSHLNHLFKKELNISVMQYIRNKKLMLAHKWISEGEKPTEIFVKCGFSNYATFYRAYYQYFGHSPSDTKKKK